MDIACFGQLQRLDEIFFWKKDGHTVTITRGKGAKNCRGSEGWYHFFAQLRKTCQHNSNFISVFPKKKNTISDHLIF